MNLNEDVLNTNRAQNRARLNKTAFNRRNHKFVKPAPPKPRRKPAKSSTTSSINWGAQNNCGHSSTTLNTGSSSRTTTTSGDENEIILALTESRGNAASEVGMAVVNLNRPSMILCQLSDTQSYINTLTKINILNPTEIIVPTTFIEGRFPNRLLGKIQQQFSHLKITGFARSAFNKANGIDQIRNLCLPQFNSVLLTLQHKYYCLSAASALLLYIENLRNVYYASESVKVVYEESEGSMIIDISAADKLELVTNERIIDPGQKSSLLAVLNKCVTRVGNRALRSMVLQPPCSVPDIEARLDCVTELQNKPQTLNSIQAILMKLNNVDQILSLSTLLPDPLDNYSERQINYILLLNLTLDQIAPLKEIFEETDQQFFLELHATLSSPRFASLKQLIAKTFQEDAYPAKGSNAIMQRCFAIKPGVNSLLDAVRKTYSELLDEMRNYVEALGKKYGLPLTLSNNNKKGFHMVMALTPQQKRTLNKSDLPEEFTQICRLSGSFTMKTEELTTYSVRIEDITANILQISNGIIRDLLMKIRDYLDIFYKLIEDIAKLDVLQSLTEASSGNGYVRPNFADYTDIANAKHPMLDILCSKEPVANPIQASSDYNTHIITGPNGSGKSIYIRQVALIQIMAQVGCYVPATSATLRVCDRLFTRISLDDNMECNISTFELELLEIKNFLTTMTKNSLIIIDELCRSTAVEEGTALAMAICEKILMTPAFIFLTTHYTIITKLQELYCNVKVWQMEATVTGTEITNTRLDLKYNLIPGCTSLKRYSIYLIAKMWPQNIVKYIENILDDLSKTQTPQDLKTEGVSTKSKLIYEVKAEFESLKRKNQLTKAAINTILNKYQLQLQECGVKVVHEGENSEREKETLSATQVTYDYVPEEMDESNNSSGNSERVYRNVENMNYLIPHVSLREESGGSFICSPNEQSSESVTARGGRTFETVELTPIPSVTGFQKISQSSIETNVSNRFFDAVQSPSFADPCCSKYLTPEENFNFTKKSQSFFIREEKASTAGIKKPSQFVLRDSNASDSYNRSKEQFSFLIQDEEIYPTLELTDGAQQNSSSKFFEKAPPSKQNASSLNQSTFNVGLSGNMMRTSTPLSVTNEAKESTDEASSVNAMKFMASLKQTTTPGKQVFKPTFGCVFEAKKTNSSSSVSTSFSCANRSSSYESPSKKVRSLQNAPESKKVKISNFDFNDKNPGTSRIIDRVSASSNEDDRRKSFTPTFSKRKTQALVSLTGKPSAEKIKSLDAVSSKTPVQKRIESSTDFCGNSKPLENKSLHEASVSSKNQTKTIEIEERMETKTAFSSFGSTKPFAPSTSKSKSVDEASTSFLQDGKQKSSTEKSAQNTSVSSTNQVKLTPFERGGNISALLFGNSKLSAEKPEWKTSQSTFFGNRQPMILDFEKQSTLANKSVHEPLLSFANQANTATPFFKGKVHSSVPLFGNSTSGSCANQPKSGTNLQRKTSSSTPKLFDLEAPSPQKKTSASTSFGDRSQAFAKKSQDAHQTKIREPTLRSSASGILEPMVVDFEEKSTLANKSVDEGAVASINEAKVTTPAKDSYKTSGSCKSQQKLRATSLQSSSTSKAFVEELKASDPSQPTLKVTTPQTETSASTSFSGPLKTCVANPKRMSKDIVHKPHQKKLKATPLQRDPPISAFEGLEPMVVDFGRMSTLPNRSFDKGFGSSEWKIQDSFSGGAKFAERPKSFQEAKTTQKETSFFGSQKQFCLKSSKVVNKAKPTPISLEKSIPHASSSYLEEECFFADTYTLNKKAVAGTSSSSYCTPNENPNEISKSSSLNCSKFLTGITETSTPLNQNEEATDVETSISYSPLCSSPTKPTPSTSTIQKPIKRLGVRCNKFIPPNKLTKRQIEKDFAEQTRKMMESGDESKVSDYARRICNRPTVRQLQQSEHIASIKRTGDGVVVIPATERKKRERKRVFNFNAPIKVFEPNLLSDANEEKFMEFLERGKKNTNVEVEQKQPETDASSSSSKYVSFTPDGRYYKEHKVEIKRIVQKYLQPEEEEKENSAYNTANDLSE